ncbi:MAG: hypothetical protein OEZ34_07240 [Spirochaetia bacterium]|nr:hypothetical protein [Spirochaetia bacterium]
MNRENLKFLLFFAASLFLLDAAFSRYLAWVFPNETAWGAEPHYNYEYRIRQIKRNRTSEDFLILIAGSSIAEYSINEEHLASLLNQETFLEKLPSGKTRVVVSLLTHQGQNSVNLLSTADRILSLEPDLVIHPVNMIEFRLERPLVLGNLHDLDQTGERKKNALDAFARSVVETEELKLLGPYGLLKYFSGYLTFDEKIRTMMSCLFATYRYRNILHVPFARYYKNRFGKKHSYHYYTGADVGGGGVNHNGHIGTEIEIQWNEIYQREGFEIQIYPQMITSSTVYLEYSRGCSGAYIRKNLKPGWQKLFFEGISAGEIICMKIHPGIYSDFFADTLGGRLSDNSGTGPSRHSWVRKLRREDDLYLQYTSSEYRASFEKRLMRFDRAGMAYLQAIMQSKKEMAKRQFDPEYPVFQAYFEWKKIVSENAPLLIVNAPENPIALSWYAGTDWYRGYLNFLACGELPNFQMYDESSGYPEQLFYDFHHMSWYGAEKFTERISRMIMESYPGIRK